MLTLKFLSELLPFWDLSLKFLQCRAVASFNPCSWVCSQVGRKGVRTCRYGVFHVISLNVLIYIHTSYACTHMVRLHAHCTHARTSYMCMHIVRMHAHRMHARTAYAHTHSACMHAQCMCARTAYMRMHIVRMQAQHTHAHTHTCRTHAHTHQLLHCVQM